MQTARIPFLLLFLGSLATPVDAGTVPEWVADDEIEPAVTQSNDRYGYTAAIEGRWLAVGSPNRDPGGCSLCGAVFLYRRDPAGDWIEMDVLSPSGSGTGHSMGYHMDFDGGGRRFAVSAVTEDSGRGAAYIYELDAGTQTWS